MCLYKYVDLTSKFLIKMHTRKEPPSYRLTSIPLLMLAALKQFSFCRLLRFIVISSVHGIFHLPLIGMRIDCGNV